MMSSRGAALTRPQLATIDTVITLRGDTPGHRVDLQVWTDHLTQSVDDLLRLRAANR